ncbi:MAG: DUF3892 domain-containing protein [Sphingomonas sp.]|uniref:DUF3892 domain-containing protein n=1 Tax=Sphingomonas sp. TaxID=28214 RepID=UPI001B1B3271|nr:DUF3892 domain-containing protein [Sphingomonas sp.]MBO9623870.1 DUF3892 domain-containing protein [Sphingomonas sp.]
MADYEVTCIQRDPTDLDRRIERLGGPGWNDTIDNVIFSIETDAHRFWTSTGGRRVWLVVRRHPTSGRLYLATENDGYPPNKLLSLPHWS